MDAKTKALELFHKYAKMWHESPKDVKECALICCDEIIADMSNEGMEYRVQFWNEVKNEIHKL